MAVHVLEGDSEDVGDALGLVEADGAGPGDVAELDLRDRGRVQVDTDLVDVVEYTGDARVLTCSSPAGPWSILVDPYQPPWQPGDTVAVHIPTDRLHLFDPHTGRRITPPTHRP